MKAESVWTYRGTGGIRPDTVKWDENNRGMQPSVPFGSSLMKPLCSKSESEEIRLRREAGRSVERLMNQQNHLFQRSAVQQVISSQDTYILLNDYDAKLYDKQLCRFTQLIRLEKGNFLRQISTKSDGAGILKQLKNGYRTEELIEKGIYVQCVDLDFVYARVTLNSIAKLTPRQMRILKPIKNLDSRLRFFNSDDYQFVEQLKVGDEVVVQTSSGLRQQPFLEGTVDWIGELEPNKGYYFWISFEDTDSDGYSKSCSKAERLNKKERFYFTGDELKSKKVRPQASSFFSPIPKQFATTDYDCYTVPSSFQSVSRRNVIRDIPIRLVGSGQDEELQCSTKSFRRAVNVDNTKVYSKTLPRGSSSSRHVNSCSHEDIQAKPSATNGGVVADVSTPILITEAKLNIPPAIETVRVNPSSVDVDIGEGDRVVYTDLLSEDFTGTVRWIGYLKGHQQLYAGIEFDKQFGKGTGHYEKCELFSAKKDHAGFLPIGEIRKIAGPLKERTTEEPISSVKAILRSPQSFHVKNAQTSECKQHSVEPSCASASYQFSHEKGDNLAEPLLPFPSVLLVQGSCVVVQYNGYQRYGVVKWIGTIKDSDGFPIKSAAVEIDGSLPDKWPNALGKSYSFIGQLLFNSTGEVTLVPVTALFEDNRFSFTSGKVLDAAKPSTSKKRVERCLDSCALKSADIVCAPANNFIDLIGTMKGIQGCKNSCYIDSTLYAMFVQSTAFDSLLLAKKGTENSLQSKIVLTLSLDVVIPLRRDHFVSADRISKLRALLQQLLPEMPGLTSDEKDPEELLTALFHKVFKAEPFLSMRGVNDGKVDAAYICPIITDDVWSNQQKHMVCVQSLLERSLYSSGIQFSNEPKILIIQLPRYGKEKVFCKVVPQQELDVTHLIYNMKRPCAMCNKQAELTCPECFLTKELLLSEVTYCDLCYKKAHAGFDHQHQLIKSDSSNQSVSKSHESSIVKHKLQLSAVLSIETSHYVAFVRVPTANKWLLFDSMADRVGLENGYNVPKVKCCDRVAQWLSESGVAELRKSFEKQRQLPYEIENDPDLMRLISDCYICIYTSDSSS